MGLICYSKYYMYLFLLFGTPLAHLPHYIQRKKIKVKDEKKTYYKVVR